MNHQRAARRRAASRLIGYLGVLACAATAGVWYILNILIKKKTVVYFAIRGRNIMPKDLLWVAGGALLIIAVAIVLRARAAHYAKLARKEALAFYDGDGDEPVYREEAIEPIEVHQKTESIAEAAAPAAIAAPADNAATASQAPAAPDKVIASFEVRVPSNPAKEAKKAEKKAKREEKASKFKVSVRKKTDKILPPEKREELKKKAEQIKKAAKVIVPVAVACVVVAKVAKKRKKKKQEKEKARNRQQFYQWLG